ncbi:PDZ domain-containing protein [bacterium]|nr:PDZ domain-containing protein [bacterium]
MPSKKKFVFAGLFLLSIIQVQASKLGYYRYPAIYEDVIVFTAEGDLWKTTTAGGTAQRLTTHHGMESRAAISPDGKWIAYSAEYEGPTEVYVIPIDGGVPERITYDGSSAHVQGWTPNGNILYSSRIYKSTYPDFHLIQINPEEKQAELFPLSQAYNGELDPEEQTLYFTRRPKQGSATKRYQGGTIEDIWAYTNGADQSVLLTVGFKGTSKNPMWWNHRIYFASDRSEVDGTMNLYSMKPDGSDIQQHTHHIGWDVYEPDLHNGKIVYQSGADLWVYDIAADETAKIDIELTSDFDQQREKWIPTDNSSFTAHLSPEGDKVAITVRGNVFTVPVNGGRTVFVNRNDGVRYRDAQFMPNGDELLVRSDQSGEVEYWTYPANGVGSATQHTSNADIIRYQGVPSPDNERLAFADHNKQLWLHDFSSGESIKLLKSQTQEFSNITWSPDSRYLAFSYGAENEYPVIKVYSIEDGHFYDITSDRIISHDPAWDPNGNWLYYLAETDIKTEVGSPWGFYQPEPYINNETKLYAVALQKGNRFPFQDDDELYQAPEKPKKRAATEAIEIDWKDIRKRVYPVPISAGNYNSLSLTEDRIFLKKDDDLQMLKIGNENIELKTAHEKNGSYELSLDAKSILLKKGSDIYVVKADASVPFDLKEAKVSLSDVKFSIDPKQEWKQIFVDAWRMERDYFYDPNLHGVDYQKELDKYLPLVDRIADREELNHLIDQIVGELSALHNGARGGDVRDGDEDVQIGYLGAVLKKDEDAGGYLVDHIYQNDPDYPENLSPLDKPGVDIHEGDILTSLNGVDLLSVDHPNQLLRNQAGNQVLVEYHTPGSEENKQGIVVPLSSSGELNLRLSEWEYTRRLKVDEMSGGQIGYVHIRAMGGGNYPEWVRNYYPVYRKAGLIVDVRYNLGGNIDSWILSKLIRKNWFYWQDRSGEPTWNMQYAFRGHVAALCNQHTYSDGEAFAEGIKRLNIGPLIGMRTWGGEIWLSSRNRLVDGGIARAAMFGVYGPKDHNDMDSEMVWLVEGEGVVPDIDVDNEPHQTFLGKDAQLEKAVEVLMEEIKNDPRPIPTPPPFPDKSFDYPEE